MASVLAPSPVGNPAAPRLILPFTTAAPETPPVTTEPTSPAADRAELLAAAWHAIAKAADKPATATRAGLPAGTSHDIDLRIVATIDDTQQIEIEASGTLSVGHDSVRASSSTPDADRLLATVLAKLNRQTREAILRDVPEEFAANGNQLPELPEEAIAAAKAFHQRLRAKVEQKVKGTVRFAHKIIGQG
jgi:hypothetical protein